MHKSATQSKITTWRPPNKTIAYLTFHKWLLLVCNIHMSLCMLHNQNQSLVKSELRHYFIRLTMCFSGWNFFLLPWKIPEEISRQSMLFNNLKQYLPYQTYVHKTFHHGGAGLTWNGRFNGSIYCVGWYLHILCFHFVRQKCKVVHILLTFCKLLPVSYVINCAQIIFFINFDSNMYTWKPIKTQSNRV